MSRLGVVVVGSLLVLATTLGVVAGAGDGSPEQIHISATGQADSMVVTFNTMNQGVSTDLDAGYIEWGESSGSYPNRATAFTRTYSTDGSQWPGVVHIARATNLKAATKYYYRCATTAGTSAEYTFTTQPATASYPTTFAMFGDLGEMCQEQGCGNETFKALHKAVQQGELDLVVHVGDIAYTSGTQSIWDNFLNEMQPVAANLPYMTIPGNHEHWYNFTGYKNRWAMPGVKTGTIAPLWNSFDYSGIHFIGFSTEHDFYPGSMQYKWIVEDLKAATANRKNVPWIVFYGHRPCYCSTDDYYDCEIFAPLKMRKYIEPLLKQYNVDLYIAGHLHNYERMYPVFNATLLGHSYTYPASTIHVVAGMAGDDEGLTNKWSKQPNYSAVRDAQLAYARVTVKDANTLQWDLVLANDGSVRDTFTLVKKH